MDRQEMYEFLKQLTFDYYSGKKTRKETVDALLYKISPADEIPPMTNEERLIFNLYWDLLDLTHDPPYNTEDAEIEYYVEVFDGKREFSHEDFHKYWAEKQKDNADKSPEE